MERHSQVLHVSDECMGVGNCAAIAPEIFALNDEGYSEVVVDRIPESARQAVETAIRSCPTGAIEFVDGQKS